MTKNAQTTQTTQTTQTQKKNFIFTMETFLKKYKVASWGLVAVLLLALPFFGFSQYTMRIVIMMVVYSMLGIGLNVLTGYTGQVSLGHAGFFAIGAYTSAICMLTFHANFFLALLAGGVVSAICGLMVGLPSLRLTGSYLTIVTLGFGEIVRMIIISWQPVTNGTYGLKNIPKPELFGLQLTLANNGLYYLVLVLALVISLMTVCIIRSNTGRAFQAIKEDEMAATMMGIRTMRYKVLSFVISAFITGLVGGFYSSLVGYIDANVFIFDVSVLIISVVIVGGMGTMRGMFLGAALLIAFPEVSRSLMEYRFVMYGLLLVIMMRFRPQGLLGWRSQMPYHLSKKTVELLSNRETDLSNRKVV